jgi:hypothetical protein
MVSDFVLMFDNACKYNEPDSQIYKVTVLTKLGHFSTIKRSVMILNCNLHWYVIYCRIASLHNPKYSVLFGCDTDLSTNG